MNIKQISVLAIGCCAILTSCNKNNSGLNRHSFKECDYSAFATALTNIKNAQSTIVSKTKKYNLINEGNIEFVNKANTQYKTNGTVTTSYNLNLNNNYSWKFNNATISKNFYKSVNKYSENISTTYGSYNETVDSINYGAIAKKSDDVYYSYYNLTNDLKTNKKYAEKVEDYSSDFDYVTKITEDLDSKWITSGILGYAFNGMITGSSNDEYFYGLENVLCADTLPKLVRYYQEQYKDNKNYSISVNYGSNDNSSAMVDFNAVADIYLFNDLFTNSYSIPEGATNFNGSTKIGMFLCYENNFISQVEFSVNGSYSFVYDNKNCETSYDTYFTINRTNSCTTEDVNIKDFSDPIPE